MRLKSFISELDLNHSFLNDLNLDIFNGLNCFEKLEGKELIEVKLDV